MAAAGSRVYMAGERAPCLEPAKQNATSSFYGANRTTDLPAGGVAKNVQRLRKTRNYVRSPRRRPADRPTCAASASTSPVPLVAVKKILFRPHRIEVSDHYRCRLDAGRDC